MTKILVVEDERIVALDLQRSLTRLGYEVTGVASSSAEALAFAALNLPDLVLMDIYLGEGPDGIDTAEALQRLHGLSVIFLTAFSGEPTLRRASATHPYGYLLKPFTERELHATITMAMERRRSDLALREQGQRLQLALDAAGMGIWELDAGTRQVLCNARTAELFGLGAQQFEGSCDALAERVHPDDRERVLAALNAAVDQQVSLQIEFRGARADGHDSWLRLQAKHFDVSGSAPRVIGVAQDITEKRLSEVHLRQAFKVFESAQEAIFILDAERRLVTVNKAFCAITGYSAEQALVMGLEVLPTQAGSTHPPSFDLWDELKKHGAWQGELRGLRKDGESYPVWFSASRLNQDEDRADHTVGVFSDISELRQAEGRLHHLAHHDTLTGLPNRLLAMDRLEGALARSRRQKNMTAVVFVDLDHFKRINDTLGHRAGDDLLRLVAARLESCVRAEDTVARLGGDEFLLILEKITHLEDVAALAQKLLASLEQPVSLDGHDMRVSASLGISMFPFDAGNRDDLIRAADTAMYAAKERGRSAHAFYVPEMTERVSTYLAAERELRRAVIEHELVVHYQPQLELATGRLVGVEALVRWQHPARGLLGADEVIPIAEESGLIVDVGRQVLEQVCAQVVLWREAGWQDVRVAVNVSAKQLQNSDFPRLVARQLAATGLPASCLELELTESTLQHEDACLPALRQLAEMGIALAIDDFGTGYSSLASLQNLPIGRCKIDQSFVEDIRSGPDGAAMAAAVVGIGRHLKLLVTAEGVETAEQATSLRALGCDDVQGFLYGHPMSAEAVSALLPGVNAQG